MLFFVVLTKLLTKNTNCIPIDNNNNIPTALSIQTRVVIKFKRNTVNIKKKKSNLFSQFYFLY